MTSKNIWLTIVGLVIGGIGGWLYYYHIGCNSGTCAITSKPLNSTLYGSAMGALLFNSFSDLKKSKDDEKEKSGNTGV